MPKTHYLYQRKRHNRPAVWYVRFRKANGSIGSPINTQAIDRGGAEQWVIDQAVSGRLRREPIAQTPTPTFAEYAAEWWLWDGCPYMRAKIARGFTFSRSYAGQRRSYLQNRLLPRFGPYALADIKPMLIDQWVLELRDTGLSPASCNRILSTLKVMLAEAVRLGLLPVNPASAVGKLKEEPKERGILTRDELKALFGPGALEHVWGGDLRHYACNLLAASAGLRLGECQGLQVQCVAEQHVHVVHGWNDRYGLQRPKWNSVRVVPIPALTSEALHALIDIGRWGEPEPHDLVFWGVERKKPLTNTAILRRFKSALRAIGLPEQERAARVLVFHSHRHGLNTLLRGRVADEQLRRVTGHKTLVLTDSYDHADAEHLGDVLEAQGEIFNLHGHGGGDHAIRPGSSVEL